MLSWIQAGITANRYKLKKRGIVYPKTTVREAKRAGIPLSLACALLEQESSGGHNVFGHDPVKVPQIKGGEVTRSRYRRYKALRPTHGMQGVGPMQLTWWTYQDAADKLGGCWKPAINMRVGFKLIKDLINQKDNMWTALKAYNGTGEAASRYASQVVSKQTAWHNKFIKVT